MEEGNTTINDIKLQRILSQLNLVEKQSLRQLLTVLEFDNKEYLMTVDKCWDPNIMLPNGKTARTTAIEAVQRRGPQVSPCAAMERIMLENPVMFDMGFPVQWILTMKCGDSYVIDRAVYMIEREDYSACNAVNCIMFEYLEQFYGSKPLYWDTNKYCIVDGHPMQAWNIGKVWIKTKGYTAHECMQQIMSTYPDTFYGGEDEEKQVVLLKSMM